MARTKRPPPPPPTPAVAWLRARAARDKAMAKVARGADPRFVEVGRLALRAVLERCPVFISDDVTEQMDIWSRITGEVYWTRDKRAIGPCVMVYGAKQGWMVRLGDSTEPARRENAHQGPSYKWRSLLYQNPNGAGPLPPAIAPEPPEGFRPPEGFVPVYPRGYVLAEPEPEEPREDGDLFNWREDSDHE